MAIPNATAKNNPGCSKKPPPYQNMFKILREYD
jgi:hypothetical protein